MNLLLTGTPDFLLDILSEMAKQRGHSITRLAPVEAPSDSPLAMRYDVVIVAALGQPILDAAKLGPLANRTEYVAIITQDKQPDAAPLPFVRSLSVIIDLPAGPGDPSGRLTYWTRQMTRGDVLAFGKAARRLVPFIDVRDASAWILESVETGRTGKFRLRGEQSTLGELLETVRPIVGMDDVNVTYVDDDFLRLQGVDAARDLPLWSPPDAAPSLAGGDTVEAEARLRPLKQTIQDAVNWEAARVTKADEIWLSAERAAKLLIEWPKYDPTGEKRRQRRWKLISACFWAVVLAGVVIAFLAGIDDLLKKATAAVRSADNGALMALSAFQPKMLPTLYAKDGNHLFVWMGGNRVEGISQVALFVLAAIGATPRVFWDLYVDGGIINFLGGLLTLVFGILAWPVLMRVLFEVARFFPRVFPQLEGNVRRHGVVAAGRTLIALGIPVVVIPWVLTYVNMLGPPPPVDIIMKYTLGTLVCIICAYAFVSVAWRRIDGAYVDIISTSQTTYLIMPVVALALTLMAGTGISAGLQILLARIIRDVDWLDVQLATGTFLGFLTILDGVHIARSAREVVLDFLRLRK
jgi:hypothetical protein